MADNYLEKRYEETLGSGKIRVKKIGHTVDELLLKNRSTRAGTPVPGNTKLLS